MKQSGFVLKAEVSPSFTDLDAIALLADYGATFNIDVRELSNDLSYVLVGHTGILSNFRGAMTGREGRVVFGNTGLHVSYQQASGGLDQFFHFWSYVNTVANGVILNLHFPFSTNMWGNALAFIGDIIHEDLGISKDGNSITSYLGSDADKRLTYMGIWLGNEIYYSGISSQEIGDWIRDNLTKEHPLLLDLITVPQSCSPSAIYQVYNGNTDQAAMIAACIGSSINRFTRLIN